MIKPARATGLERIELERLRDRVGQLFAALEEATLTDAPATPGAWAPPVDLSEAEDAITVRIELPGVKAEQIKIAVTTSHLRVCGEKKKRVPQSRILSHLCSERSYGHFSRVVPLRWTISVREATAQLSNGVLTVRLPKRADRRGEEFGVPIEYLDR
jgi:HSP20 family protein